MNEIAIHPTKKTWEDEMKTTVNKSDFRDAFRDHDRQDQFSYDALGALFGYLEDYEDNTGELVDLDVIALCCDFSEYNSAIACVSECGYDLEYDEDADEDEKEAAALEYLRDNTTVIQFATGIIIQGF